MKGGLFDSHALKKAVLAWHDALHECVVGPGQRSAASMAASSAALAPEPLWLPGVAQPPICRRCLVKRGFFKGGKHRCRSVGERMSCRHCTKMHKKCRPVGSRLDCSSHADGSSFLGRFGAPAPSSFPGSRARTRGLLRPRCEKSWLALASDYRNV